MSKTQSGTLLIADITGYTFFLSESELEHAQEILETLLEILIKETRPPLIISRTAGDAVISYAIGNLEIQGQTFFELLEHIYLEFRQTIELMVLNNRCNCAACANISNLDLKFFVHYGVFGIQKLGGHDELVGSDVNLIHRLLKNHIIEATGIRAYAVLTAAAVDALGLSEIAASMVPHQEAYEHLGQVDLFVHDMAPKWKAYRESNYVDIPPDEVLISVEREFLLPQHMLWDVLTQPKYRSILMGAISQTINNKQEGRIAPGTEIHCDHGKSSTLQRIRTWRPFEMMVSEDNVPFPRASCLSRFRLTPTTSGTCLQLSVGSSRGSFVNRTMLTVIIRRTLPKSFESSLDQLNQQLIADGLIPNPVV